jgi:hypothetical protein
MNSRKSNSVIQLGTKKSFIQRVFPIDHKKVLKNINNKLSDILKENDIEDAITAREMKYAKEVLWGLLHNQGHYYKNYGPKEIYNMLDVLSMPDVIRNIIKGNIYLLQSINNKTWL